MIRNGSHKATQQEGEGRRNPQTPEAHHEPTPSPGAIKFLWTVRAGPQEQPEMCLGIAGFCHKGECQTSEESLL